MPEIPTFDYLVVIPNGQGTTKYVSKSRSINFNYNSSRLESYRTMVDSITNYLSKGKEAVIPTFVQIYSDSITIKSAGRSLAQPVFPLRSAKTNLLIKIPFTDVSESFQSEVTSFISAVDSAATGV